MGYKNREIEFKLVVSGNPTMASVVKALSGKLGESRVLIGSSIDVYYVPPKGLRQWWDNQAHSMFGARPGADFIRVRCMENGTAQMTTKHQDKKIYQDRVEIDVPTESPSLACAFLQQLFGLPQGYIHKAYHVFFIDDKHTTVSLYQVKDDPRVFVEVEAKSMRAAAKLLAKTSSLIKPELIAINKSLYDLILKGKPRMAVQKLPRSTNSLKIIRK